VLIYELCNGLPPFYQEDRLQMYQKIMAAKYTFPATFSNVGDHGTGGGQPGWAMAARCDAGHPGWLAICASVHA
jgi:hypothetical protein